MSGFARHIPTWAPFSGFKRDAEQVKTAVDMMFNLPYEAVKKQLVRHFRHPLRY